METATENLNLTRTTPLGDHLNRNKEEGLPFKVYAYENLVSVETTLPFDKNRKVIDIYNADGTKITRESTMKDILSVIIREG
jgi:hypothetical protein